MELTTLLAGAAIALGSAFLGVISEAAKSWITRRTTIEDKKKAFQHRTAVELQETIHDLLRGISDMHDDDVRANRKTGNWGVGHIPTGVGESHTTLRVRAITLVERLDDEDLRAAVQKLVSDGVNALGSLSLEEAANKLDGLLMQSATVNKALGKVIRESWPE